jgi:hemolysin activation/secretion protein
MPLQLNRLLSLHRAIRAPQTGLCQVAWRLCGCGVVGLVATASAAVAQAQSSASPEGQQRRQQERQTQLHEQLLPQPDVYLSTPGPAVADPLPIESPCFVLHDLQLRDLQGQSEPEFEWLLDRLKSLALTQCLGVQGLTWLLHQAQHQLIERGYVTTRILAGAQDMGHGRLVLTLVPGRLHAIRRADPLDSAVSLRSALPMQPGDLLNLRDIEQALENLRRVPSAEADIQIEPAQGKDAELGDSDLVIRYHQTRPMRLGVSVDDSGTHATGKYQASVTLSVDQPLNLNDLFYLTLSHNFGGVDSGAHGMRGTQGHTAHYDLPWGNWLLGVTASHNAYFQHVAGASQAYIYRGTSENNEFQITRLLHRDAAQKLMLSLRAFQRKSNNYIDDTEIQVQRRVVGGWDASLQHKAIAGATTLDSALGYKRGTGAFGALSAPEESFGEGDSRFALLSADLNLNHPFRLGAQTWRYSSTWRIQSHRTPLTPQDRFAIGGRYSVRGFDGETVLSAERGWLWRNDLGFLLGDSGQDVYVALDHGEVGGPSSQALLGRRLSGAVLGWRGRFQSLQFDFFMGAPVQKPDHFPGANWVVGFSLLHSF